eukprot:scaffold148213_cov28-Tisochrysis_lutea.AAC.1
MDSTRSHVNDQYETSPTAESHEPMANGNGHCQWGNRKARPPQRGAHCHCTANQESDKRTVSPPLAPCPCLNARTLGPSSGTWADPAKPKPKTNKERGGGAGKVGG